MPTEQFIPARLKIEWAVRHIKDLETGLTQLRDDTSFYRLYADTQGHHTSLAIETEHLPPYFALHIGDAVHCLRSALDYLTSDIARRAGKDSARIHFPFHQTRDELIGSSSHRIIQAISPDIADIIVDVIKPYEAGNYPLWALNRLDNIDKHRLLIPVLTTTGFIGVCAETSTGQKVKNCRLFTEGSGRAFLIGLTGDVKITNHGKPAFDIRFDTGQFFDDESIIPTLHQLAKLVLGAIETLETHCFGSESG